jgi:hypothetical protein
MGSLALSIQSINSYSSYMRSETPICSTTYLRNDHFCRTVEVEMRKSSSYTCKTRNLQHAQKEVEWLPSHHWSDAGNEYLSFQIHQYQYQYENEDFHSVSSVPFSSPTAPNSLPISLSHLTNWTAKIPFCSIELVGKLSERKLLLQTVDFLMRNIDDEALYGRHCRYLCELFNALRVQNFPLYK